MVLIGVRLLGRSEADDALTRESFWDRTLSWFQPQGKLYRLTVPAGSELGGKTVAQTAIGKRYALEMIQVGRKKGLGDQILDVRTDLMIEAGDVLFVAGMEEGAQKLAG